MTEFPTAERRADSERRRQRVLRVIAVVLAEGGDTSVSAVARAAGVDRTFLYRHRDLLTRVHAAQLAPPATHTTNKTPVTTASLKADLANHQQHIIRLTGHNRQLEKKLSTMMGEQSWQESGLGSPTDIDQLQQRITVLEQRIVDVVGQLRETTQELDAARAANRELFANNNKRHGPST